MALDIKIPSVGESITEVTIASWLKKDGDFVNAEDLLCEIESDKATFELNAEKSGVLKITVKEGETINIGDSIGSIDTEAKGSSPSPKGEEPKENTGEKKESISTDKNTSNSYAKGFPSPAASKIMAEKGLESGQINGTGKDGRITKDDANKATALGQTVEKTVPIESVKPIPEGERVPFPLSKAGERNVRREKMSSLRKTIAKRLVEAKNSTAMLTTFNEVDMFNIMEMRKKYKDIFKEKHGVGLGFMSLFAKACIEALKEFPAVNAQIDGTDILYHDFADISIAVSTPKGLVVPVIRNAETLSLSGIEKEVLVLAGKARDGKLTIEEMTGGTFTITNGGVFGSMLSTPIINAPQSAILGMHNIVERPVALNGQVVIRPIMYVALSYDHRIVDGRESVSFLKRVKEMIEDPYRLLLEV